MAEILHRVGIKSSVAQVYKALTTRDGLACWWASDTQGDGQIGSTLKFSFSADGVPIGDIHTKVLELYRAERVLWQVVDGPAEWIGTTISWDLKQQDDYCIVLFKHQQWKEAVEFMHHCSTKWALYLMSLKSFVETGTGAANPDDVKIGDWN